MSIKRLLLALFSLLLVGCAPALTEPAGPAQLVSSSLDTLHLTTSLPFAVILLIGAIAGSWAAFQYVPKFKGLLIGASFAAALVVQLMFNSFIKVDQGQAGVHLRMGQVIGIVKPGAVFVLPFTDEVVLLSTRVWTYATMTDPTVMGDEDFKDYPVSFMTENVLVSATYTVQGRLNPDKVGLVYERFGTLEEAIKKLVKDISRVEVKNALNNYPPEALYAESEGAGELIADKLGPVMDEGGLVLVTVGIRKPVLGQNGSYEAQLDAAETARVEALTAQQMAALNEAVGQQAIKSAEAQKQVDILDAEARAASTLAEQRASADARLYSAQQEAAQVKIAADAEAYKITTEAEAQAAANELLTSSLTAELIEYNKWLRWNGQLPQVQLADGQQVIVPIPAK